MMAKKRYRGISMLASRKAFWPCFKTFLNTYVNWWGINKIMSELVTLTHREKNCQGMNPMKMKSTESFRILI